jgi:hypothetical protein
MAKEKNLIMALMMAMLPLLSVRVSAASTPIPLTGGYEDPNGVGGIGAHRSPVAIPEIKIDGYTLFFMTPCDGCVLRLLDENRDVVYSTVIPDSAVSLVLPSYLSGEYEIQIIQGSLYFWGYVDLCNI